MISRGRFAGGDADGVENVDDGGDGNGMDQVQDGDDGGDGDDGDDQTGGGFCALLGRLIDPKMWT